MGEIADMMLDGTLCESCGAYMEGSEPGHPRQCSYCNPQPRNIFYPAPSNPAKVACEVCGRHIKAAGLADHVRDKHGSSAVGKSGDSK